MSRKPHVHVQQDAYLDALREVGQGELADFAEHFDVSPATARRNLDGLVAQGKAARDRAIEGSGRGPLYRLPGAVAHRPERAYRVVVSGSDADRFHAECSCGFMASRTSAEAAEARVREHAAEAAYREALASGAAPSSAAIRASSHTR